MKNEKIVPFLLILFSCSAFAEKPIKFRCKNLYDPQANFTLSLESGTTGTTVGYYREIKKQKLAWSGDATSLELQGCPTDAYCYTGNLHAIQDEGGGAIASPHIAVPWFVEIPNSLIEHPSEANTHGMEVFSSIGLEKREKFICK